MSNILQTVHVAFALPYFLGEQFCFFQQHGFDTYICCSPSSDFDRYISKRNIERKSVSIPILRKISPIGDFKSIISLCQYIHKNDIDIVIGHSPKGGLLSMIAGFVMRRPKRIYFRHGLVYETSTGLKRHLLMMIERITSQFATQIVCVSNSIYKQSVIDNLGSISKLHILNNGSCAGVDTFGVFNPLNIRNNAIEDLKFNLRISSSDFIIGFCGRLTKDKGIEDLLRAFKLLKESSNQSYKLLLVGDNDERVPLADEVTSMINEDSDIIKIGLVTDDIQYYYALMDLFILPSYREGFPVSTLEALSMGKPVLTTRATGCIDSIIDGETGYFISHSPSDIATRIIELSNNNNLYDKMSNNARNFVINNYSNEIVWSALIDLIRNK